MMQEYKPAINWGIRMGIVGVLLFLVIYAIDPMFFGTTKGWIVNLALSLIAIPVLFMILGSRDTKKNFTPFTFGNAFTAAFLTGVVAAIVNLLFSSVFITVIDPTWEQELYEQVVISTESMMEDMGAPQESIDQTVEQLREDNKKRTTGVLGALKQTGVGLFWYALLALIIGAVQKDKKDELTA